MACSPRSRRRSTVEYRVDLNADLGEGAGNDAAILDFVTSANIACGGHAGDPELMASTIELAKRRGVAIGAHPGYPDRGGFGRRQLQLTPQEIHGFVLEQISSLLDLTRTANASMHHVKPHGALYNAAATDRAVADAIATAIAAVDPTFALYGLAGSDLIAAGEGAGLRTVAEGFADRTYAADGTLTPRSDEQALIQDPKAAAAQAIRLVTEGKVRSLNGSDVELRVDTICIHGDSPHAVSLAQRIRLGLEAAGIKVAPPPS
ncbi:MAG TPA: 5-oxoprolinase subunit PxpA [Actinomycetota bacterium]|nr:5-oxoprolinase subunit PxpA [Actinomycetota bacterium]